MEKKKGGAASQVEQRMTDGECRSDVAEEAKEERRGGRRGKLEVDG